MEMTLRGMEVKAVCNVDTDTIIHYLEEEVFACWRYPEALLNDNGELHGGHKWKHIQVQQQAVHTTIDYSQL